MIGRWVLALVALWLAALALPSSAQSPSSATGGSAKKYRVVMQVSDPDPRGWNQTLNNALQLTRNAGKQNVEIEIVANGMGSRCSSKDPTVLSWLRLCWPRTSRSLPAASR